MRAAFFGVGALAVLGTAAAAQFSIPGMEPEPFPVIGIPLQQDAPDDNDRRLPYRDLTNEIRIEVDADLLYDFQGGQVRQSASDLLQQAANLIYERAKSPVRIECHVDRGPAAAEQKTGQLCAIALAQYLITQEKVTGMKFTSLGMGVPPPAPRDPNDPLAPLPVRQSKVVIDFLKK
jgi:outer membrane protein OmpA-like peptidoglycan-associated protein